MNESLVRHNSKFNFSPFFFLQFRAPPSLFLSLFLFLHWSILPSFLFKAHLGGEAPSCLAYSLVDGASSLLFSFAFLCISMVETHHQRTSLKLKDPASIEAPQASFHHHIVAKVLIDNGSSLNIMPKATLDKL